MEAGDDVSDNGRWQSSGFKFGNAWDWGDPKIYSENGAVLAVVQQLAGIGR